MKKMNLNSQKGFTLVELIFVGIAVILVYGIFKIFASGGISKLMDTGQGFSLSQIRSCAMGTKSSADFTGVTTASVIATRCLDDYNLVNAARDAIISDGVSFVISSVTYNGLANGAAQIVATNYDAERCNALIRNSLSEFSTIAVGTTVVKAVGDTSIAPATISAACANNVNVVTFVAAT
jgi:hypothetical protein